MLVETESEVLKDVAYITVIVQCCCFEYMNLTLPSPRIESQAHCDF